MLTKVATVAFVAVLSLSPPLGEQNPADELAALKREIQALKEQQAQMQKELQAIKSFLQAAMQPRQPQEPEVPGLIGAMFPTNGEPAMGSEAAKVTIVEISDYHCPFCKRHTMQTFPQIVKEYVDTGKVRYVFVDYPIAQLHPQAARSHEAAACAGEQGKFWQMHSRLFGDPPAKDDNTLVLQAQKAGAEPAKFWDCLKSGRTAEGIKASVARIEQLGISGTPMTIIGLTPAPGQPMKVVKYVYGARPYPDFKSAIDAVLQ
jgi:protein-disulfide isomerase